ncbi:MAG: AAA-like domain-containing protein, partial [Prochlorotrichaceae cyanobacterium]
AQVLAQVASNQISRMQLWQTAHQETGVFGSHLVYHRLRLEKRSELLEGMQLIAQGKARQVSKDVAIRLEMAGLVKSSPKGYVPRCGIYELYFRDLSANSAPELPSESGNSSPNPRSTEGNRGGNPWTSGSFYLLVAVVVMSLVAAISRAVDLIVLPIVLVSGVLVVMVIGAFQLRQDDRFSEAGFVTLMQETLKRLPLIRKVMPPSSDKKS